MSSRRAGLATASMKATGMAFFGAVWLLCGSSCVLGELTTGQLCGRFQESFSAGCDTCSKDACCAEERACQDSPECAALYGCLGPCDGEPTCIADCAVDHANDDAGAALAQCHASSCMAECSTCAGSFSGAGPACDDCTREACCDVVAACRDNERCTQLMQCTAGCSQSGCFSACISGAPAFDEVSGPLANDFLNCQLLSCKAACALGTAWSCAGEFNWSLPEVDTLNVRVFPADPAGGLVEGLTLSACDTLDLSCESPLATTSTTDETGAYELSVASGLSGFTGYLEARGAGHLTTLFYFNEPIVRNAGFAITVVTQEQLETVAQLAGADPDPQRGHLNISALDCLDSPGVGIQFDVGEAADTQSTLDYGPDNIATTKGNAQWANLLVGSVELVGRLESTGETIAAMRVQIRPSVITQVRMSAGPPQ
jgi:hypothetical protein